MARVPDYSTSGMIALVPAEADIARLTVPGGDPADQLHMTLAYLGDQVDQDYDPAARAALADDLRQLAARTAPVAGHAMGHSVFNPDGDEPATVYMVTGADLSKIREQVSEHDHSEHPMWLPHVTAGYNLPVAHLGYTGPVRFDRVRLALGDDVADFPLTGDPAPDYDSAPAEVDGDDTETKAGPGVAGVALMAADTGRVLMLQRALDDDTDPAAGTWEFPGGHIEDGDTTSLHGGIREWTEEVGQPMPPGGTVAHTWTAPNGKYQGHVVVIDAESDLDLGAPRSVHNPDDDSEQVAWWDPDDARKNPALRKECRRTPWPALTRAVATVRDNTEGKALTPVADLEFKAADSHTPPAGVRKAAQRGLDLVKAGRAGQNFTDVGRKRASDLARGAAVSVETARRMKAYFDRHQADRGAHWGKAGAETPGYVAWQCWGGDAGYAWARRIVRQDGEKGAGVFDVEVKATRPEAREPVTGSGAAASTQTDGKKKRKVASKAGENRYGLPIGTELGKARDDKAKASQSDKGAQGLYDALSKVDPAKYREHLDKLKPEDLQKLSRLLYSSKSSNPAIVKARLAIASALKRRGMDVNDHGGLGRSSAKKPAAKPSGGLKAGRDYVDLDDNISDAQIARLKAQGWKGRPGDGKERLYRPGAKGADPMTEVKQISTARREKAATLPGTGSPGKFPIDSEATLRSAIRLHNSSDEPADKVRRHIMTQARNLGLEELIPDDWSGDDAKGLDELDVEQADAWLTIEAKRFPFSDEDEEDDARDKQERAERDDEDDDEDADDPGDDDADEDDDGPPWGKRRPGREEKAAGPRTTTKPWETRKAQRAGKTIGKEKSNDSDGGDEYPLRTIGDVAAAIKKVKTIKDPERKKEVQAHIRAGAKKINASNMIPKDWGSGGEKAEKKAAPTVAEFSSIGEYAAYIESKVMSPDPRAARLRTYWAHGEGRAKWRPGSPGDFERLRRQLRKHVPMHMLNGLTANIHKLATGEWPGKNAHGKRGKGLDDWIEPEDADMISADELKAAGLGLDGGSTAVATPSVTPDADDVSDDPAALGSLLDSYADMADQMTTAEEYEEALADQIDWDMLPPAELVRSDHEPERGPGRPAAAEGADDEYDLDAMLDELAD